jgi:hypothetical protein
MRSEETTVTTALTASPNCDFTISILPETISQFHNPIKEHLAELPQCKSHTKGR